MNPLIDLIATTTSHTKINV